MTTNYILAQIDIPPPEQTAPHYIFIVDNRVCSFEFDDAMEDAIFRLANKQNYRMELWKDMKAAERFFYDAVGEILESKRTTVLLGANPFLLKWLHTAGEGLAEERGCKWLFVSFFHSDEDTAQLEPALTLTLEPNPVLTRTGETALDQKAGTLLAMAALPFVKKVEIPLDKIITEQYLQELFEEYR
ncbi:MAG: hypothetical protein LBT11_00870 [Treponema sp.]|jgi:hypothetical protein|nr:hypothetical protein [Treponema sp.]